MSFLSVQFSRRRVAWTLGACVLAAMTAGVVWFWGPWRGGEGLEPATQKTAKSDQTAKAGRVVRIDAEQREALGVATAEVTAGPVSAVLDAPGQVIPDESRYAYITPRAKGVIREVKAQIGEAVKADQLLATIDSSEVARGRLALIDSLMRLEIARAKLNWQETIYQNAIDMIAALRKGPDPDEVQREFAERPVGKTREQLLKAYSLFHLSEIASERFSRLKEKDAVPVARFEQERAEYQVDKATFQGLMDRMAYEVTLDYTNTRRELREARTAVKVARETLRVYGVPIENIAEQFESGELTGDYPHQKPRATLREAAEAAVSPSREISDLMRAEGEPVSTYELRAPFDGTILERDRIVPGVIVDGTHHLFTMASLDSVWVEAFVHESDFALLSRSKGGRVEFTSPAYPDEVFEGRVIYTGDMVDQKSRAVRMLAAAKNPERKLKPGMFVTVEIHGEDPLTLPKVPKSALLTDNDVYFVFVQTGPDEFERREVEVGRREGDQAAVNRGIKPGDRVVVRGAFELKSKAQASRPDAGGE